jgi:type 1 fimbria pilin
VMGSTLTDSTAYAYNGNTIIESRQYQRFGGPDYTLAAKAQYIYSANNLTSIKVFDPGTNAVLVTSSYEYDNKPGALSIGKEAFLPGLGLLLYSTNNLARANIVFHSGGLPNTTVEYTYQYNSANLPVSGSYIQTPDTRTTLLKFTYQ